MELRPEYSDIEEAVREAEQLHGPAAHRYDFLDAAAAAWTARRIVSGIAEDLGDGKVDETGYPMSTWV